MTNERDDSTTGDELNPFYSEETAKVVDGLFYILFFSIWPTWLSIKSDQSELCSTRESIVKPDKDLIEQINELFPTEQSLSQLDSVSLIILSHSICCNMLNLLGNIISRVRNNFSRRRIGKTCRGSIRSYLRRRKGTSRGILSIFWARCMAYLFSQAQSAMTELEKRIDSIREKTQSSDAVVREMTRLPFHFSLLIKILNNVFYHAQFNSITYRRSTILLTPET